MRYRHYKKAIAKMNGENSLNKLLEMAENDFSNISDGQYYNLKTLVLRKIYA